MIAIGADHEKCQGYANCIVAAPDVFDIDDDGVVVVLRDVVDDVEEGRIEESVRSCPVAALRASKTTDAAANRT